MKNWRIFAKDGALLGIFMMAACAAVGLIEHPASPVRQAIVWDFPRRSLVGFLMGVTAVVLIYSPWGKQSGAFMNPAVVIGHWRLKRLTTSDAVGYAIAQFVGGAIGVAIPAMLARRWVMNPAVQYVVTVPGSYGLLAAWVGEFVIALVMMSVVLFINRIPRLAPATGVFAATLLWIYITFEAPLSGMSLNPARTFGSALFAGVWTGWWIYLTAPVVGMLCGIELHRLITREHQRLCGKLNHSRHVRCFIACNCLNRT